MNMNRDAKRFRPFYEDIKKNGSFKLEHSNIVRDV